MYTLHDIDLTDKRVLVRSDLNVPIAGGKVLDDARIVASMATYKHILDRGGKLAIMSHLGRPDLTLDQAEKFSLAPLVPILTRLLGKEVELLADFTPGLEMDANKVYLYENTRLMAGEKSCCAELSQRMASCCDVFVMDAFASCHRKDASTYGIFEYAAQFCAGLLLEQEITELSKVLHHPNAPVMAVVGGAKITGKIDVILSLLDIVDHLIVVGAMANTFLAATGCNVGASLYEADKIAVAKKVLTAAEDKKVSCYIPQDVMVMQDDGAIKCKDVAMIRDEDTIYDVGTKSLQHLAAIIAQSRTLIWNGPLGKYEDPRFAQGGIKFAQLVAQAEINSVAGGGDTISVIKAAGVYDDITYVSTGGGAFLALLEDKSLPCLEKIAAKRK